MKLKIYGCRGSIPSSRKGNGQFGGNTTCLRLFSEEYSVVLDAGSGLVNLGLDMANSPNNGRQDILLSHLHLDHILGLCAFPPAFDEKQGIRIYTASRGKIGVDASRETDVEADLARQIFGIFKPPFWPVALEEAIHAEYIQINEDVPFALGPLTITPFTASHPDRTTSFHITNGKKTLIYLLDSEIPLMDDAAYAELVTYCKNADMVVFDAAYSPDDYAKFKGWGHSTVLDGVRLRKDSNCKHMLFSHFAPKYSDEEIFGWQRYFDGDFYTLATDEMEVVL